jgi:hypothetical protein
MRKTLLIHYLLLIVFNAAGQPATEVFLFDLDVQDDKLSVRGGQNISSHKGYDNQPFFHPDETVLYYTSADGDGRTDIKRFNYKTGNTTPLTTTPEREYSPTVTPDKHFISCIIQRDNGAQDLGKYPIEGGTGTVIINNLKVGYHAWLNDDTLILFVLGEPMTLRRYEIQSGRDSILVTDIGRSLHRIPHSTAISFVHKSAGNQWTINKIDERNEITTLANALPGGEDLAWTPTGWIIMSDGKGLYATRPGSDAWEEVGIEGSYPLKGITRIAVNARGDKLALVTEE